ncbi:DNA-binding protein [Vagococcus fluvialis]|uniref:DNA-binding protein n=1 Tax=Vagococcus fluvialis TaxID=2738 RepID=UPI00288E7DDF|nr:DNA-binding protein [Vagococcus fluvialis]MDT2782828.1 DNA-binding protein [Vagococcus fluvialis]
MKNVENIIFPFLLTRNQASEYLGIDPKSFDKYVRSSDDLKRFMIGKQERYTIKDLEKFIISHSIN